MFIENFDNMYIKKNFNSGPKLKYEAIRLLTTNIKHYVKKDYNIPK